jgi:hypothetical protein
MPVVAAPETFGSTHPQNFKKFDIEECETEKCDTEIRFGTH